MNIYTNNGVLAFCQNGALNLLGAMQLGPKKENKVTLYWRMFFDPTLSHERAFLSLKNGGYTFTVLPEANQNLFRRVLSAIFRASEAREGISGAISDLNLPGAFPKILLDDGLILKNLLDHAPLIWKRDLSLLLRFRGISSLELFYAVHQLIKESNHISNIDWEFVVCGIKLVNRIKNTSIFNQVGWVNVIKKIKFLPGVAQDEFFQELMPIDFNKCDARDVEVFFKFLDSVPVGHYNTLIDVLKKNQGGEVFIVFRTFLRTLKAFGMEFLLIVLQADLTHFFSQKKMSLADNYDAFFEASLNQWIALIPGVKKNIYDLLWGKLTKPEKQEACVWASWISSNYRNVLLLEEDDPLIQKAFLIVTMVNQAGNFKNPYTIYADLKEMAKEPFPDNVLIPITSFNGVFILNKNMIKEMGQFVVKKEELKQGGSFDQVVKLFGDFEKKLNALDEVNRQKIEVEIFLLTESNLPSLKENFISDLDLEAEVKAAYQLQAGDRVFPPTACLIAILAAINAQPNEIIGNSLLTPREEMLIQQCASIFGCPGGKREGSLLSYRLLEEKFQYQTGQADTSAEEKTKAFILKGIEKKIFDLVSGDNEMMKEMTGVEEGEVEQLAHQSIYLKNVLLPHIGGFRHQLEFDLFSHDISTYLIQRDLSSILSVFYKYFTLDSLISNLTKVPEKLYGSLDRFLKNSERWRLDEDGIPLIEEGHYFLTRDGVFDVLIANNFFVKPNREFYIQQIEVLASMNENSGFTKEEWEKIDRFIDEDCQSYSLQDFEYLFKNKWVINLNPNFPSPISAFKKMIQIPKEFRDRVFGAFKISLEAFNNDYGDVNHYISRMLAFSSEDWKYIYEELLDKLLDFPGNSFYRLEFIEKIIQVEKGRRDLLIQTVKNSLPHLENDIPRSYKILFAKKVFLIANALPEAGYLNLVSYIRRCPQNQKYLFINALSLIGPEAVMRLIHTNVFSVFKNQKVFMQEIWTSLTFIDLWESSIPGIKEEIERHNHRYESAKHYRKGDESKEDCVILNAAADAEPSAKPNDLERTDTLHFPKNRWKNANLLLDYFNPESDDLIEKELVLLRIFEFPIDEQPLINLLKSFEIRKGIVGLTEIFDKISKASSEDVQYFIDCMKSFRLSSFILNELDDYLKWFVNVNRESRQRVLEAFKLFSTVNNTSQEYYKVKSFISEVVELSPSDWENFNQEPVKKLVKDLLFSCPSSVISSFDLFELVRGIFGFSEEHREQLFLIFKAASLFREDGMNDLEINDGGSEFNSIKALFDVAMVVPQEYWARLLECVKNCPASQRSVFFKALSKIHRDFLLKVIFLQNLDVFISEKNTVYEPGETEVFVNQWRDYLNLSESKEEIKDDEALG